MFKTTFRSLFISLVISVICLAGLNAQHEHQSSVHSQYSGQQDRSIKSLTPEDIRGLKTGAGTPFNGMAKPAELNGYPGPRHVLDAFEAGEFDLTNDQLNVIQSLYNDMQQKAIPLGKQIVELETELDTHFTDKTISDDKLKELINASAQNYAELRYIHLSTHLEMINILSNEQIILYNDLRGYSSGDPCQNIPEGHDPEMWKKHNGCDS
ncbi:MAG: hypothetical protein U5K71_01420 [Gracilimonas sp.]|nr:hypothetical protein [Gracilimonas sp.]